ncbi:hypothetical protein IQ07DRAFT_228719 [Pyrenochaeta sp. DS3sAY3a]|nr:hypothetical protein IQ07DRAFT_228719 [Pyrenochaeta sp. DS3sAY3a]
MAGDFLHLDEATITNWPEANFSHPSSRDWYPAYSITLLLLTSAVVFARLLSQATRSTAGLGIDDLLALIGWVFSLLLSITSLLGTQHHGFNRHLWDVSHTSYNSAALIQWLSEGAFILSISFTKISVLLFFRRLEPSCSVGVKRTIYGFMTFTAVAGFSDLLVLLLQCRPVKASWTILDITEPNVGDCINKQTYYPAQGLISGFSTVYTIMVPALVLQNIPMTKSQRTGLRWVSLLSLSVLGVGIARTVFLYRIVVSENGDATCEYY